MHKSFLVYVRGGLIGHCICCCPSDTVIKTFIGFISCAKKPLTLRPSQPTWAVIPACHRLLLFTPIMLLLFSPHFTDLRLSFRVDLGNVI